jgi:hypothetical protein
MRTKLTLRVDKNSVDLAKTEAMRRGKSVSQMFEEFVQLINTSKKQSRLPPITSSLRGLLKGQSASEEDYKVHVREKHLENTR